MPPAIDVVVETGEETTHGLLDVKNLILRLFGKRNTTQEISWVVEEAPRTGPGVAMAPPPAAARPEGRRGSDTHFLINYVGRAGSGEC